MRQSYIVYICVAILRLYQKISHTILPRTCRFYPTCSQYALESLQKFGFWKGASKALLRILRCSPMVNGGYDPLK